MNAVKVTGNVDANHQLLVRVPETVPPGPVTVLVVPVTGEDEAGIAWAEGGGSSVGGRPRGCPSRHLYARRDGEPVDEG